MEAAIISAINLLILIVLLVYKLRQPVVDFVDQRHHSIRGELQEAREKLRIAQEKYDEFSARLKAIDTEVGALREQTKQDSLAIRQRIVNESSRMASMIASDSRNAAEGLFSELKEKLYLEWSAEILERAEQVLKERLNNTDRARIREEFGQQLEVVQ